MNVLARPQTSSDKRTSWVKTWPCLIALGTAWGLIVALLAAITDPMPESFTLAASVWFAGLYTLSLRVTRKWWRPRLLKHPLRNAVILGAFNAAVIEIEFLVFEKIFGAEGITAHPNLLVDLVLTMPWYILMVLTFVKTQHHWRFPAATVLFLGGIYEMGADGIVAPLIETLSGSYRLFTLEYWLMMAVMYLWVFIPVYSSMLLPPAWLVATIDLPGRPTGSAWSSALKPILWLLPFALYLLTIMLMIFALSG